VGAPAPPRYGLADGERALEALPQGPRTEREHERDPAAHRPDWLSREGAATEHTWPPLETPLEGALSALEAKGTWKPKGKPPWKAFGGQKGERERERTSTFSYACTTSRLQLSRIALFEGTSSNLEAKREAFILQGIMRPEGQLSTILACYLPQPTSHGHALSRISFKTRGTSASRCQPPECRQSAQAQGAFLSHHYTITLTLDVSY
jgi:hypothetical protein